MHRYKIFLKIGETVEVKAEAVKEVYDAKGNIFRLYFVNYDLNNIIRAVAMFYAEDISSWAELPESEEEISNEKAIEALKPYKAESENNEKYI